MIYPEPHSIANNLAEQIDADIYQSAKNNEVNRYHKYRCKCDLCKLSRCL